MGHDITAMGFAYSRLSHRYFERLYEICSVENKSSGCLMLRFGLEVELLVELVNDTVYDFGVNLCLLPILVLQNFIFLCRKELTLPLGCISKLPSSIYKRP